VSPPIRRPIKELKGFAKQHIEAGSNVKVEIVVDLLRDSSYWDEMNERWCSHAGAYNILVGTSSAGSHLSKLVEIGRTTFGSGI
jgi:beta-glucosidase